MNGYRIKSRQAMRAGVLGVAFALSVAPVLAGAWVKTNKGCAVWNSDPKPGETATWTGACANGKVNGKGKLTWKKDSQASIYVGSYKAGKRSGTGTFNDGSGNWYFADGMPHGTGHCFAKQLGREWKCSFKSGRLGAFPSGSRTKP